MPDPTHQTVSASQAPALFNQSPYTTKFMLFHHFKSGLPIDARDNERIRWGKLLQDDILEMTQEHYRAEVLANFKDEYTRAGQLGATVDGRMMTLPGRGRVVVEAKNIDWLHWRNTWTETSAAIHVEIQIQTQLLVDGADLGIISALVGGNDMKYLEREPNKDLHQRLKEEAASFFDDLAANREPDPLGSPLELPMLALLYPETVETKVVEDFTDEQLALAVRQFRWASEQESFARKLKDQTKALILARAGEAGVLRAAGATAFIKKFPTKPTICAPHSEPKQVRKGGVTTTIDVQLLDAPTAEFVAGIRGARFANG